MLGERPDPPGVPLLRLRGNPRADNILEIIKILQANEQVQLRVEAHKAAV